MIRCWILFLLIVFLGGCGNKHSEEFDRIDALCDRDPHLAMAMLDSMDVRPMSKSDRHRYDLLAIKSRDKAYVQHSSDSLILDVISWYEEHKRDSHYAEALYYGGRVYSDLGDFPTALDYFHKALDVVPNDKQNLLLRTNILSQTGRLLEGLRLYSDTIPYVEQTAENGKILGDSVNLVYDNLLLEAIYRDIEDYTSARKYLMEAFRYSKNISIEDQAWINVEFANILKLEGKTDSALNIVRPLVSKVDTLCRNYTLGVASDIYRSAGILDTAYMYSRELAKSEHFNSKRLGFWVLLSKEVFPLIPRDSLPSLIDDYESNIEKFLDTHESQEALIRQSKYNYSLHVKEREKVEKQKSLILQLSIIFLSVSIIAILFYKYKHLNSEMRLRMALQVVERIEERLMLQMPDRINAEDNPDLPHKTQTYRELPSSLMKRISPKDELLKKLELISARRDDTPTVDVGLHDTSIFKTLRTHIRNGKGISYNVKIWKDIEEAVNLSSPDFKERLELLASGKMSKNEYEIALLIRFGILPKEMTILLNRSKSAISDRRSSLARKIFGNNYNTKALDRLILFM